MRRIVNVALLLATIVGAIMAFGSARKLHGLQTEYECLSRTTGKLVITDPTQIHLIALPTDEPFHFAWRVYLPAGQLRIAESTGDSGPSSSSTSSNSEPREFIARIRFSVDPSDRTSAYSHFANSSGAWSLGSSKIFQFLEAHRSELKIEQLGAATVARVKPGEPTTLLRVCLPERLAEKARQSVDDPHFHRLLPKLFECRMELDP